MKYIKIKRMHLHALMVLASLSVASCSSDVSEEPSDTTAVSVQHYSHVLLQTVPMRYVTSGTVTSDHSVSISSRLSGYIRDIKVREGDKVEKGQLLLIIDSVDAKQALIQAQADLKNAKAEMNRYTSLLKAGAVTSQQADKVALRYRVAKSHVAQAQHQLSYAKVLSPVSGVVVQKRMSQGDLASPGAPILSIEDPSSLLVETYVSEQFVGQIHEGDAADVEIASFQTPLRGTVRQVVQAADPVSHQFLVKTALPSARAIHPGMYAQTGFHIGERKALLIPEKAIVHRAGLYGVYTVDEHHVIHYRQLRLGKKSNGMIEILAGLHDGDGVVWDDKLALKSGMKVQW